MGDGLMHDCGTTAAITAANEARTDRPPQSPLKGYNCGRHLRFVRNCGNLLRQPEFAA